MIAAAAEWSDFGLPGMVIGGLFALLMILLKIGIDKFSEAASIHHTHLKEIHFEHREERREWMSNMDKVADRITDAIKNLK